MSLEKLPAGWVNAHISDLCTLNPKHDKKLADSTAISFVPMAKVSGVDGIIQGYEIRPLGTVRKGYTHFADNDIIWAKITPCMENGKSAIAQKLQNGLACGSTEFFVLRTNGTVTPTYLHLFIRQEDYRKKAKLAMSGAVGHQRVPKDYLMGSTVPLPPLPEQKRIATKIDALQAKSKKAREALDAARPLLDKLRQSILAAAFRGDLTADWRKQNPDVEPASKLLERIRIERRKKWEGAELAKMRAKGKEPKNDRWKSKYTEPEPVNTTNLPELPAGWCWTGLQQLLAIDRTGMRTGPFGTLLSKTDQISEGVPVLGIENIGQMKFLKKTKIHITKAKAQDLIQYDALPDDVIISRSGTVGEVCIVPPGLGSARISTNLIRVSLEPDGLRPYFLGHIFTGSPIVRGQIRKLCSGSSRDFLNQKIMKKLVIPMPPLAEQDAILKNISSLLLVKDTTGNMLNKVEGSLMSLDQSILAKAFRGELVPQDPNDEPAAVLLERIKAERALQKPKRGKKKTKKKGVAR